MIGPRKNHFWNHIEKKLRDRDGFFVKNTLYLKFYTGNGIGLNINGVAFVYSINPPYYLKNNSLYMPDYITEYVKDIYVEYKGIDSFYAEINQNSIPFFK